MVIRQIREQDAQGYLECMLALDKETTMMLYEPGERTKDITKIQSMIKGKIENKQFFYVVEENDKIVGFLGADKGWARRIRHSAYIVIGIRQEYTGQGIGSRLFEHLMTWTKDNMITRLELTVVSSNTPAVTLYQKYGFEIEGIKRNSMKIAGAYVDEYYMAKIIQ